MRRYTFQAAGALIAVVILLIGIFRSTNSTASIGFIFLPVAVLFGAFVGDALKYIFELTQKKRPHSTAKSLGIAFVFVLCAFKFVGAQTHSRDLGVAGDPSTSADQLLELVRSSDQEVVRAAAANPSLSVEALEKKAEESLLDYYVMSGIVINPNATQKILEHVAWLEPSDFKDSTEYDVYQTYVWAPLARRQGVPEPLIHKLCAKKDPSHFLILALLDSPFTTCEEKKHFLPQKNPVLESAIENSMAAQNCARD